MSVKPFQARNNGDGGQGQGISSMLSLAGTLYGGSVGGTAGAAAGGMAGGMLGSAIAPEAAKPTASVNAPDSSAMSRRMDEINQSPQMKIANSINSLQYIEDPEQRAEIAKPLFKANYIARNQTQNEE